MSESIFDKPVDRSGTYSAKWDIKDGELPMWVADMDFLTAPAVTQALVERAQHGVFGYTDVPDEWYEAYISHWQSRHNVTLNRKCLVYSAGVVPTISSAVRKLTTPGENVCLMTPVYNIFYNCVKNNGRNVIESPLVYDGRRYHIDFEDLKELGNFALEVAGGASAGAVGGALTAIGAYGAATTFASASTGTAISTLSGIAAQNATLAFFGGGSLASGGLGMAGGMMVLGGLVAGPALMVMGLITSAKTQEKLENALANKAQADEIVESLNAASYQCSAIRRRSYMFYNLLAHMDSYFLPQVISLVL